MRPLLNLSHPAMLIAIALLGCLGIVSSQECESKQFMSIFLGKCINCTECLHPDVTIRPCEKTRDTTCGPPSMLKLDWSWTKHQKPQTEPVKEMTQTFQENMQEIKLHEMHVKQMRKRLRQLHNGGKESDLKFDNDILNAEDKMELWDNLKALGWDKSKTPEIAKDLVHNLHMPRVLSEDPKILEIPYDNNEEPMHFTSKEASDLLKSAPNSAEDDYSNESGLKFDHELLVKKFGFFPIDDDDDEDEDEDDLDDVTETESPFSFSEQVVLDYQTGLAVISLLTLGIFFTALCCYCCRISKSTLKYPDDLRGLQFWTKKQDKLLPSTIYKTTTEVISKESNGHCKYLERLISKPAKKIVSRVPSNVYRSAHPSKETRPLTDEWKAAVHTTKLKFPDKPPTV